MFYFVTASIFFSNLNHLLRNHFAAVETFSKDFSNRKLASGYVLCAVGNNLVKIYQLEVSRFPSSGSGERLGATSSINRWKYMSSQVGLVNLKKLRYLCNESIEYSILLRARVSRLVPSVSSRLQGMKSTSRN